MVGFCLAVRRDALEAVGGLDEAFGVGGFEDDDLCRRLVDAGGRLLIAHESFVHHDGHVTFAVNGLNWYAEQQRNADVFAAEHPLVSACLIVGDEEEMLPDCLTSLVGLVDEVVVYDTGSSDRTVDVARARGARVVQGYWDDDFARARNAALEHCRGRWVLHLDADERVRGDVAAHPWTCSASASTTSPTAATVSVSHRFGRLFRRGRAHWSGRLHEHLVPLPGTAPLTRAGPTRSR